jgi:hypothetical protein
MGLPMLAQPDEELRRVGARVLNTYYAEAYAGYRDRLEPVAVIPMGTPEEAVEELEVAVGRLGLRTVVMSGVIPRGVDRDGQPRAWIDTLGHGSLYDYDPVWAKCLELGVAPTFHGVGYGWGTRASAAVPAPPDPRTSDDFADALVSKPEDLVEIFERQFFFGCEADDPLNALAFDRRLLPHGARLNAVFASDIGHWDVPDMREVLPEAWELVEDGRLGLDEFRDFSFGNVVRMLTDVRPDFFEGTAVADAVRGLR